MNCWEILGISPTGDQHLIKKAYAHAATLHHPEDDPDGFQIVYHAFKEAIAFAKAGIPISAEFSISQNSVDSSSDEQKTPVPEQDTPKQPDFDTSLLQGAVNEPAEKEEPKPKQPDFDTTLLHGAVNEPAEKEKPEPKQPDFDTTLLHGAVNEPAEKEEPEPKQPDFDTTLLHGAVNEPAGEEEPEPKQPDFDTTLLHGAVNEPAEGEKPVSGQPAVHQSAEADSQEEEYDFDYDNVINRGKASEQKKIDIFLETMDLNYRERKTLRSTKLWEQCFSSTEFLSLRSSEEFTKLFLTYQMDHIDIKPLDWCRVFAPMLREWMYFWPAGVLNEKFRFLLRQRNKFGFKKKQTTHRKIRISWVYIFLGFLVAIGGISGIQEHFSSNSENSSSPSSWAVPVCNLAPRNKLDYLYEVNDVITGMETHEDYSELQQKCEDLGVNREKYEQMSSEYAAGDKKSFNRDKKEIIDSLLSSSGVTSEEEEASAASEPVTEKQGSN